MRIVSWMHKRVDESKSMDDTPKKPKHTLGQQQQTVVYQRKTHQGLGGRNFWWDDCAELAADEGGVHR